MQQSIEKYYTVEKKDISYLKFIIESYEGIAFITTLDKEKSIIKVTIPKDLEDEADKLLNALQKEIILKPTKL